MGNLSGTEILIIGLIALIVLGPDKLPDALRKLGGFMRDVKRVSSGFQNEIRNALNEPLKPGSPSSPVPGAATSGTATSGTATSGTAASGTTDPGPANNGTVTDHAASTEPVVGSEAPAARAELPAADPQPTDHAEGAG